MTAGTLLAHLVRAAVIDLPGPLAMSLSLRPPLEYVIVVADVRLTPIWSVVWWGEMLMVDSSKLYPHQSEWRFLGPLCNYHQKRTLCPSSHDGWFSALCRPWCPAPPPSRYFKSSLLQLMCRLLCPGAECSRHAVEGFSRGNFKFQNTYNLILPDVTICSIWHELINWKLLKRRSGRALCPSFV